MCTVCASIIAGTIASAVGIKRKYFRSNKKVSSHAIREYSNQRDGDRAVYQLANGIKINLKK